MKKNHFVLKQLIVITMLITAIIWAACNKKFDAPPDESSVTMPTDFTIKELKALHTISGSFQTLSGGHTIGGVVIANDSSGNLYQELVIRDSTGAIPVLIDESDLYNTYPVGRMIYIKLDSLTLGDDAGTIELGADQGLTSAGKPAVTKIASKLVPDYITGGSFNNPVKPVTVTFDQLNPSDMQDPLQSQLIELDGFQFPDDALASTYADSTQTVSYADFELANCSGQQIELYNSSYADFAGLRVPEGNGSITGIYTSYNGSAQLQIRDTSDVQFYTARCDGSSTGNGAVITIGQLRALYQGSGIKLGNYTLGGTVISDATGGNVSKGNFILQSGSYAIDVYTGGTITYNTGDSVVLSLTSSDSLETYGGALELECYGAKGSVVGTKKTVVPAVRTISDIKASLAKPLGDAGNYEYALVQINNASVPSGTYSGSKTLTDGSGSITLYTSSYAAFADAALPGGNQNWVGYAHNYNSGAEFSIRNTSDVTATGGSAPADTASSFTAAYDFGSVTNATGTADPTAPPVVNGLTFGSFTAVGVNSKNSSGAGRFSFTGWPTDNAPSDTIYYSVTITPASGKTLDLSGFTFTVQRSGTGAAAAVVKSSIDGYSGNLPVSVNPANSNLSVSDNILQIGNVTTAQNGATITLGSDYSNITSAVTFRFYGFGASSSEGTFSIDNVVFSGSVK